MPKTPSNHSVKLRQWLKDYGGEGLETDGDVILCTYCDKGVSCDQKSQVKQHVETYLHSTNKARHLKNKLKKQLLLTQIPVPGTSSDPFSEELCEALISADIPLSKLNNEKFRSFLEKHCKRNIPDESTLRKNYLP